MLKQKLRALLIGLKMPVTKNIKYDILTKRLLKNILQKTSNCIDIGGFKGEILLEILKFAPNGTHYIFEPIPDNCQAIRMNLLERKKERKNSVNKC